MRHQMKLLEDEADGLAAKARQFGAAKLRGVGAVDAHRAAGRLIETADQVQQRGLAGAGGPHDGDPFAAFGGEADAIDAHARPPGLAVDLS